jgi:hypothetical protein
MKSRAFITAAFIGLGVAIAGPAMAYDPMMANDIVCFDPVEGMPHDNPAECAQFVGFNGPGLGGQFFTANPDEAKAKGLVSRNGQRFTPADIMLGPERGGNACMHRRDLAD